MSVQSMPPVLIQFALIDVMTQMYRMAGVLKGPGRGMSGSEQQEGCHIINALLDGIKIEPFFFYQILRTVFAVTAFQKDYTVGAASLGADWVIERPEKVLSAGILVPGTPSGTPSEVPIQVVLSYEEYQTIVTKNVRSSIPLVLYYQASLPLGTSTLWPEPSRDYDEQVVLYTPQTVQEFEDPAADFIVPKGYREFLEYAGAVAVHDRYPHNPMDPNVRAKAVEYKSRVKAAQLTPAYMRSDAAVLRPYGSNVGTGLAFNGRTLIP